MLPRILFNDDQIQKLHNLATNILDDPLDRIHPSMRSIVDSQRPILFDVHAHALTGNHIPENFYSLLSWLPKKANKRLTKILKARMKKQSSKFHPNDIISSLLTIYHKFIVDKLPAKDTHIILNILMMDLERSIGGKIIHNFETQIQQMIESQGSGIRIDNNVTLKGSESVLVSMALDPHNPQLYNQFISGFVKGKNLTPINLLDDKIAFHGLKMYPVLGYLPGDPILTEIYKIAEAKMIPITTHCGGTRTRANHKIIDIAEIIQRPDGSIHIQEERITCHSKADFKKNFIDPAKWLTVFNLFPNLKVNLAHFGDDDEWNDYRKKKNLSSNYVQTTIDIIGNPKYPNVYADISYALQEKHNHDIIIELLKQEKYKHKILCGTDYFLNENTPITTREALEKFRNKLKNSPGLWDQITMINPMKFLFNKTR